MLPLSLAFFPSESSNAVEYTGRGGREEAAPVTQGELAPPVSDPLAACLCTHNFITNSAPVGVEAQSTAQESHLNRLCFTGESNRGLARPELTSVLKQRAHHRVPESD
ncbi:hypothetical protein ES703_117397 [subsurface metagenome]